MIHPEISRTIPNNTPMHLFILGIPIFTAYGCVLLERDTGKTFIYTAVNIETGKTEVLSRRTSPLTTSGVDAMVEKIRLSNVAGAGRLQADRPFGKQIGYEQCRETMNTFFYEILPQYGYAVREEQISLAEHMLDAINRRAVSLAEAEVGTGKTLAYLAAAVLAKRGRINGYWNMSFYTGTPLVDMAHMPIVIATSSIALQTALIADYIPALSEILLKHEIIKTPLTAALRKGREHYVCQRNLRAHIPFEHNHEMKRTLVKLLKPHAPIDLAEIDGLNNHVKHIIHVPDRCDKYCPRRKCCVYLRFREEIQSCKIDIQVCNHNYLLADVIRRIDDTRPLIPNYQSIIIDEAHKFLSAARTMYGSELSETTLPDIKDSVNELNFRHEDAERLACKTAKKLSDESRRLFRGLLDSVMSDDDAEDETDRFTTEIDANGARHLRNIREISGRLLDLLASEPVTGNGTGRKMQIMWELEKSRDEAAELVKHGDLITWLEAGDNVKRLCAIPKDIDKRLFSNLWNTGIPTILTSGTLSAGGDFTHIKRTLGLERVGNRLVETSKPSPFNYRKNGLLYISENVPFPNRHDKNYIDALTGEVEEVILASYGHAAVLFTSYKVMDMVWEELSQRGIPFPMFRLGKGDIREIERFKKSGNGVLFASGALWEGIDIPGDALSLLIMVKLPFPVPDPIGEYEQTQYSSMSEYKDCVIKPEMLIKAKQGAGRVHRTEKDTGCIAIFDSRVAKDGYFRDCFIAAMPEMRVTSDIGDIPSFFQMVKSSEYYS